jgi:YidC/Oxa1 family membrane protein insertase
MPTTFNLRIALWAVLAVTLYLGYQVWQRDYPPEPAATVAAASGSAPLSNSLDATVPSAQSSAPPVAAGTSSTLALPNAGGETQAVAAAPIVHVRTDVLDLDVSLAGGELQHAVLPLYPINKKQPDQKVELLNRDSPETLFVMQSGLVGIEGSDAPDHKARFTSPVTELDLKPGEDEIQLPLSWSDGHGVTVTKTAASTPSDWITTSTTPRRYHGRSSRTRSCCAITPPCSAAISMSTVTHSRGRRSGMAPSTRNSS